MSKIKTRYELPEEKSERPMSEAKRKKARKKRKRKSR